METALGFVEDEGVGAAADDGDGFAGRLCTGDFDEAGSGRLCFFDQVGGTEFVFGEGVDVGDGFAAGGFADEFYFVTFDVFDAEDVEFGEEVEGEFVDCVTEDRFLDLVKIISTPV